MINGTKTYLPNKEKYQEYVDEIYASGKITNNGCNLEAIDKIAKKHDLKIVYDAADENFDSGIVKTITCYLNKYQA
ncbi:MAG: hypothetical protein WBF77_11430 [Sulfurimonadaceae bacterium]